MARGRRVCTGPSRLARPATRECATFLACGCLPRAAARRCLSSCHSACPQQAWASDHATPPLVPAAVRPARARRLAVVGPRWAAPAVAAVLAPPLPGEQLVAARPLVRPRVAVVPAALLWVVRAVQHFQAVRTFRAVPVVVLSAQAAWLAAGRPGAAAHLVAVPAELLRVVHHFHAVRTFRAVPALPLPVRPAWVAAGRSAAASCLAVVPAGLQWVVRAVSRFHAVRAFHVAPVRVLPVPVARLPTERPGAARLEAVPAALQRFVLAVPHCHAVRPFRAVPVVVLLVQPARFAPGHPEAAPHLVAVAATVLQVVRAVPRYHVARHFRVAPLVAFAVWVAWLAMA